MDKLAESGNRRAAKVVHAGSVRFLTTTDRRHQYRSKAKGPLANVHSPHRDNNVDLHELWVSSNEGRQLHSLHDGCRGPLPSSTLPLGSIYITLTQLAQLAKCLKYLGFTTVCDILFGVFMVTWIAARHVIYLMVCWSIYADIPNEIEYGCYRGKNGAITGPFPAPDGFGHLLEPFRDPEGIVCWNNGIKWGFLSALLFLQGITLLWFSMIVKVAINVLRGGEADDSRSDDEGDAEEDLKDEEDLKQSQPLLQAELPPFEEEVGVEAINLKGRTSNASRYRKSAGTSSGVSIAGHSSDRKELLGRIGCDKGN